MSDVNYPQPDSDESFAKSAGKQLLGFGLATVVLIGLLMWGLQTLASLVGSSTVSAKAVDPINQSITIAIAAEPPQLDSTLATDASSGMVLGHVMEGLLRNGMDDKLEAAIAERWEVTETQAKFWLRADARWSDGEPITAHDFVFAWRTALKPENASEYAFLLYAIKNGRAINEGTIPYTELGATAVDDLTLVVDLERPLAFFDKMVSFPTFLPIREDFYNNTKGRFGADAWEMLYSGPFSITSWVHGSSLLLERNPYYWDKENISLNQINVGYITSDATAKINFFKDEKIAFTTLLSENLSNAMAQRWHIERTQDGTVFFMDFNHAEGHVTSNRNLRKAMHLVLDMEELVYKVTKLPGYIPGESLFPTWLQGVNGKFREEYPAPKLVLDQNKAMEHLQLAKQELGVSEIPEIILLSGDNPLSSLQSEWVQEVLRTKLGISVKIDKQIFKQRLAKMTAGEFDLVLAGWGPDYNDPLTFGDLYASWNKNNRGKYYNPEMDRLIEAVQNSVDPTTRMEIFAAIQQLLFDDVAQLPMYERGVTFVTHPHLKNVKQRVIGASTDFTRAYIDTTGS